MDEHGFTSEETAIIHAIGQQIAEFHEGVIKSALTDYQKGNLKPALRVDQTLRVMGLEQASLLFQTLYVHH